MSSKFPVRGSLERWVYHENGSSQGRTDRRPVRSSGMQVIVRRKLRRYRFPPPSLLPLVSSSAGSPVLLLPRLLLFHHYDTPASYLRLHHRPPIPIRQNPLPLPESSHSFSSSRRTCYPVRSLTRYRYEAVR